MRSVLLLLSLLQVSLSLDNGVGVTPPMGWLSWERYRCITDCKNYPDDCISEKLYMEMGERLYRDGYADAGYTYVNVDDCWAEMKRDENNIMIPDAERFPSGMKALGDFLHARGLKFGIYSDVGTLTCGGYPGSKGYEEIDVSTFLSWGVDSVKLDGCYGTPADYAALYPKWTKLMNETGRPMLYECSWPAYVGITAPFDVIAENCNYWRPFDDINDNWDDIVKIIDWWGDNQDVLTVNARAGAFNDPDMLIIGNFALSYEESKVQMSMWAILMAPLFMSNDLRNIDHRSREVLLNREVIAVNQDPACIQGRRVIKNKQTLLEWWTRPLHDGSIAVAVFFRSSYGNPVLTKATFASLGIKTTKAHIRDLWAHKDLGLQSDVTVRVNPHGVVMLKVTPSEIDHSIILSQM